MDLQRTADEAPDARPLSVVELLVALRDRFDSNFQNGLAAHADAEAAEAQARALSNCSQHLKGLAGDEHHRLLLATYVDEIFGDSVCALYLASCGLTVPARMLLRRSLELGLAIIAYWDSPADFWQWRDHDADIKFSELCAALSAAGYITFLNQLPRDQPLSATKLLGNIPRLYSDLSNVVHPKPYNFSTKRKMGYTFEHGAFTATVGLAEQVYTSLNGLLTARFPELSSMLTKR